jgi:hypothetical protein
MRIGPLVRVAGSLANNIGRYNRREAVSAT